MPVDRSSYLIELKTTADLSGAKSTMAALMELSRDLALQGKSVKEVNEQMEALRKANYDAGFQKAGDDSEAAGQKMSHSAEHASISHHELHRIIHALGHAFGGVGEAALLAYGPMLGTVGIISIVTEAAVEQFGKATEAVANFNAEVANLNAAKLNAFAEAANAVKTSLSQLRDQQDDLDAAFARGDTEMENRIKKYGEESAAITKLMEDREREQEQQIDFDVQSGRITQEEGERRKEAAKLQLDSARGATDQARLKYEIDQRQQQLDEARGRLDTDRQAVKDKQSAQIPGKVQADQLAQQIEDAKKKADALKGIAQSGVGLTGVIADALGMPTWGENGDMAWKSREERKEEAARELQGQQQNIRNLEKLKAAQDDRNASAANAAKIAKDQFDTHSELARSGPARIKSLQDQYDIQQRTNDAESASRSRAADTADDLRLLEKYKKIFADVQAGHASPADTALWNALIHDMNTPDPRDPRGRPIASRDQQRLFWDVWDSSQAAGNSAAQTGWSQTPTGSVPDLGSARGAVGEARAGVQARTETDAQLTALMNEFIGLARDLHGATAQQREQFANLAGELRELRDAERNNRTTQ